MCVCACALTYIHVCIGCSFVDAEEDIRLSSEKLQRLGWRYRALDEILIDSVKSYQDAGLLD